MIRRLAALVAFGGGAWYGYNFALDVIDYYEIDVESYWGNLGAQVLTVGLPLAVGVAAAVTVYFLLNLFARAD